MKAIFRLLVSKIAESYLAFSSEGIFVYISLQNYSKFFKRNYFVHFFQIQRKFHSKFIVENFN